ncbi:MAG: phosphoribosylaminoimidazolesuccinocarboxamide synthase [Chlorobium sp.]|jgi:phosphoribosylaminoimidazole-succinocarboxamide synthase|uniref:phosphoribosylaminoimidazolesuccinocarboxamide synthase n=1 Tax=Chlorobium sp. TaxID=1095 RepID=UPI001DD3A929|nr:phosphoribosylaminoimidazolesuccinocarboxamide synthase [Chlorobium sp.]MBN1279712.1 phosphoribosylaminoimidazolesuccinocarboxamide synthase [Chlorobiaceae bacterium]MCF8215967.1 phosphoribosylaminoimidazolesuccinocarboxamide synthase [Chlorobium sp.]MCF8270476.1 phosphoribosylaminoimidazolesuccinocarboxamide synthase [Chlorobium sp.]MCF8287242.1 phosphoribosylaminoimidazolesuccinocarboxamide synthase [Chlorobium sp.]MCF8290444.1 phosphoribosylaminoimidazolesuccinocarboxamide synthase [Chlo
MQKTTLLHEGKAKKVFLTEDNDLVIQEFKDDATAFNNKKKGTIADKGVVNNAISCKLFTLLEAHGVKTHLVEKLSERDMLCRRLDIIKVEVVVRNIAAGSLVRRYGFVEGTVLEQPLVEFYLKDDDLDDPLMIESHAVALGVASYDELSTLKARAEVINGVLKSFFAERKLKLVDFKLEFGRYHDEILLGDEISPDTCRFWDLETNEKMDKDRFRFDLGGVEDAYSEVQRRVLELD